MGRMRTFRRAALVLVLAGAVGCPVGCPKGTPQTLHAGPVEEVQLERLGPCIYRANPPLQHSFHATPEPMTGVYFVVFDEQSASLDWVTYEPATAIFTIVEPFCSRGVTKLSVSYHPLVRTVNE